MQGTAWVGALALMFATAAAFAAEPDLPPIPERPAAELFKEAPAPWRDYLIKAREAERIADPLERCLTYPDLPGNQWPKGHSEAHCRLHANRRYTPAEVELKLQGGEIDAFERMLDQLLERHFSEDAFDEGIDIAFELFEGSNNEIDRVSSAWLAQRPKSAYAHLARAHYFNAAAGEARGGKFAGETPRENFRRMSEIAAKAIPLYEEAIRLQPRLMPAYAGLLDVATLDSRSELERSAFERAKRQDPACAEIARYRMESLQPRWGGSYESMLAYASEISAHVARRPLLAMYTGAPFGDRGSMLINADQLDREAAEILEIAIARGSQEKYTSNAANVFMNSKEEGIRDPWKALAYLLQEARFSQRGAWTYRNIGRMLTRSAPEMGLIHLQRAAALEPDNDYVQYLIGASFYNARRFEQAQQHYLAAIKATDYRQESLREMVAMWMFDADLERRAGAVKARPYLDRLLKEYPEDGRAWLYRVLSDGSIHGSVEDDVMNSFARYADRQDPQQVRMLEVFNKVKAAGGPKAFIESGQHNAKP